MPNGVALVFIGTFTGFLAGMLGAGGGFATVVLLLAVGVGAHDTVGTSLVYTVIVGAWGTAVHLRHGTASWRLAVALGIPSAVTALAGAQLAEALSERALTMSFAMLTAGVTMAMVARPPGAKTPDVEADILPFDGRPGGEGASFRLRGPVLAGAVAGGAVIGLLKGLFGVGGGFLLVPFMVLALRVPEHVAVGSSLFAILLGSISGSIRHALLGNVDTRLLWYLIPGGIVGSLAGATLVRRLSRETVRRAFATLMVIAAIYLMVKIL